MCKNKLLRKAKERYSKEKAAEYYLQNKEAIKEKSKNRYKNLSKEGKDKIKVYQRKRYQQLINYKKEALQKQMSFVLFSIRTSEKTLKFGSVRVNKKEFHKSKHAVDLHLVYVDEIVVSDKFRHNDDGFKCFIGYKDGELVKLLCIILPQMTGYMKYFENGEKNVSFVIKDDDVLDKYNEIWYKIKETLNIKFHSAGVYDGNT